MPTLNSDSLPICCKLKRAEHPIPLAPSDRANQIGPASVRLAANQPGEAKSPNEANTISLE